MARVRTTEEVEEIKLRERMKFSLVRQQIELNREIGHGGCPTARGKVYITNIFEKDGKLSASRPHLALECTIRAHLNMADLRRNRRALYDHRLEEKEIREFCNCKEFRDKCPARRRFVEETSSLIVKREDENEAKKAAIAAGSEAGAAAAQKADDDILKVAHEAMLRKEAALEIVRDSRAAAAAAEQAAILENRAAIVAQKAAIEKERADRAAERAAAEKAAAEKAAADAASGARTGTPPAPAAPPPPRIKGL